MGVTIYDPTGEDVTPEKLKEEQQKYLIKETQNSRFDYSVSLLTSSVTYVHL